MFRTSCVLPLTLARQHLRMAYSKRISLWMAAYLVATNLQNESMRHFIMHIATFSNFSNVCRLPTDFSKPIQVDLPISHAGAFVFWVEYDGSSAGERVKGRQGYFNVDPILRT